MIDYITYWSERTEIAVRRLVEWVGIKRSKFYDWRARYGKVNEHNAWIPRDHWLQDWEREAIIKFHHENPLEGYRRLTYMMMDADVVATSPATVYRVLSRAGVLSRWPQKASKKGRGFVQPIRAHDHWHTDIAYINVAGTFYYLCSFLDGYSRFIVHWEIREAMKEADVETILQRARERFPDARPRIISDNGPQFVAKDFKELIRVAGMTHVRTSPSYPESNGKIERWHKSLKEEAIRPQTPLSLEDAWRVVGRYVERYNTQRLHSAIGYVTPFDKLEGRAPEIHAERDRKLEAARASRKEKRQAQRAQHAIDVASCSGILQTAGETDAGSAGEQPARDSRLGGDGSPSGGGNASPATLHPTGRSRATPMPPKTPGSGAALQRAMDGHPQQN